MDSPAFIICFVLLLLFSVYIGFLLGNWAGKRAVTARGYWLYNLAAIAGCVIAVGLVAWPVMLYAIPLGLLPGWITGLKMGYGESSGPWKLVDRFFNVNKAHRDTAAQGTGEARRRRTRTGEAAPDLISVSGKASGAQDKADSRTRHSATGKRKKR